MALHGAGEAAETTIGTAILPRAVQPERTGKERLGEKATDEQRIDDCKVPPNRRGAGQRPALCGGDVGAAPSR